jgi:hypothetical protein
MESSFTKCFSGLTSWTTTGWMVGIIWWEVISVWCGVMVVCVSDGPWGRFSAAVGGVGPV